MKLRGTVKFYLSEKGYGFIVPDDAGNYVNGGDVFFGRGSFDGGAMIREGDIVEYEMGNGRNGKPAAIRVEVVD